MKRFTCALLSLALAACAVAPQARAQDERRGPPNGYGIRTGFGLQPDQFVVGAQALLGQRFKIFRLVPSFDVGWGDNVTTYVFNADLELHLPLPRSRSNVYFGAGAGLVGWHFEGGSNDTEVGANLVGGARLGTKGRMDYNIEARFGIGDTPDFRLLVGVLIGSGKPQ